MLEKQREQDSADDRQIEVVYHKQPVQLKRFSVLHELPPGEDGDIVGDEHRGAGLDRGEGGDLGHEDEFLGCDACGGGVGFGEQWPELDAEGFVQRGQRDLDVGGRHGGDGGV